MQGHTICVARVMTGHIRRGQSQSGHSSEAHPLRPALPDAHQHGCFQHWLGRNPHTGTRGARGHHLLRHHTLTETERHYSAVGKEALTCLWAIEHWEKYLLGRPFMLHTDQHALKQVLGSLMQAENTCKMSKFIDWAEHLSAYDFTITY